MARNEVERKDGTVKTYTVNNAAILSGVVRLLRMEGARAWAEFDMGVDVLCTNASPSLIAMCAGDGLWVSQQMDGLPK